MYKFATKLLLVLAAAATTAGAFAQSFDEQVASVFLLQAKPIQKELGVTANQRLAMNKFADAHRVKLSAYYKVLEQSKQKPDESKVVALLTDMKKGVFAQLNPAQLKRLRELTLQDLDFTALLYPKVASRIGLNPAEQKRVTSLIKFGIDKANGIRNEAISRDTADLQKQKPKNQAEEKALSDEANRRAQAAMDRVLPRIERIRADTRRQVLAVLTPAERTKWQDLMGKPFKPA